MTAPRPHGDYGAALSREVGARLRERREELTISLRQAARDAEISPGHLSDIETGRSHASLPVLLRLGRVLRLPLADLLPRLGGHHVRQDRTEALGPQTARHSHPELRLDVVSINLGPGQEHETKVEPGQDFFAFVLAGRVAVDIDGDAHVLSRHDALDAERAAVVTFHAIDSSHVITCRGHRR